MNAILLAIYYPPISNSAAVQLGDLSDALKEDFNELLIITSSTKKTKIIKDRNLKIFYVNYPSFLNKGLLKRGILEFFLPFVLYLNLRISKIKIRNYQSVIWWSPSIFQVTFIHLIKLQHRKIKSILILRDIFPQWMIDLGGLKNKILINIFRIFEQYQNYIADIISIQSECNRPYFNKFNNTINSKIIVLPNWIKKKEEEINLNIFNDFENLDRYPIIGIYTGNIGLAQGLYFFKKIIRSIKNLKHICLVFVGRGSFYSELQKWCNKSAVKNVFFMGSYASRFMPSIYQRASFGLIVLDPRHTTNNIPGKYISYINYGLPVLAYVNKGNSLVDEVNKNNLGYATSSKFDFKNQLFSFLKNVQKNKYNKEAISSFANRKYNCKNASKIIYNSLNKLLNGYV